jgi:hypothetical protein
MKRQNSPITSFQFREAGLPGVNAVRSREFRSETRPSRRVSVNRQSNDAPPDLPRQARFSDFSSRFSTTGEHRFRGRRPTLAASARAANSETIFEFESQSIATCVHRTKGERGMSIPRVRRSSAAKIERRRLEFAVATTAAFATEDREPDSGGSHPPLAWGWIRRQFFRCPVAREGSRGPPPQPCAKGLHRLGRQAKMTGS